MLRTLVRNILSNWAGFAVHAAVAFFLTPFVLHSLGSARYGIWMLVVGLTGYYGLLDLGFRSGMTQYMTRYLATGDFRRLNATASTGFVAFLMCGVLVLLATALLSWIAPAIFEIPPESVSEARWCIGIIGVSAGIQFLYYPFSAVFAATQRYDLANLVSIVGTVAGGAATVAGLKAGYGIVGISIVNLVVNQASYAVRWFLAYRILPQLRVSPRLAEIASLWPVVRFGAWMLLINAGSRLKSRADPVIIALFLPVAAIAPFAVAGGVVEWYEDVFGPVATVFLPAATYLDARQDRAALRRLFLGGSRMLTAVAVAAAVIAVLWADDFFRLWLPPTALADVGVSPQIIFYMLMVGAVFGSSQRIASQILVGTRRLRRLTLVVVCEGLAKVALSVWLIQPLGLVGVALGTLIPALIVQGIVHPFVVSRALGIHPAAYFWHVYPRTLAVAGALGASLVALRSFLGPASNWGVLLLHGILAGGVGMLILALLGLDRGEQRQLLIDPLGRFLDRIRFGRAQHCPPASEPRSERAETL